MAIQTAEELLQAASTIQNATGENENSADVVGGFLVNLVETVFALTTYTDVARTGSAWSNLPAGSDITGLSIPAIIKRATGKAYQVASVSINGGGTFEKGTTASVTITGSVTPNDDTISSRRLLRNGVALIPAPTTNSINLQESRTTTTTYKVEVVTAASGTRSSNEVQVKFVAASFYGPVATATPSPATVKGLTKQLWEAATRSISFNCNGTRPAFAEPQTNGIRGVIKDKNGFPITGDIVRTALTIELPDHTPEVPSTELYWLYTHKNPQTDANFIFSL